MSSGNNTGIKRSINALIRNRGIDSNIARHVRVNAENCFWCGADLRGKHATSGVHTDHVVPRSKGGGDRLTNIVASCPACNLKKQARDPLEFAREVGADVEAVRQIIDNHKAGRAKQITVFHLDRYCLDAFIFRGFDAKMIEDVKNTVAVKFYVIQDGYRAFTSPCIQYDFMREEFEHYGYELIDRRGPTCPRENWGS